MKLGFGGNPGNVESGPENYVLNQVVEEIDYDKDSDEDGLPDFFEEELGTDSNNEDSDGDGLPDGYEYLNLGTDALKSDTDENGILDIDEDFDEDGLVNLEEYILKTSPHNDDTDGDDLKDKDEVILYKSNPLDTDTDDDKLADGDEIALGFNILNPDTDGDGILDGDEKTYQIYSENISEQEKPEIVKVSVALEGSGNLQKTTNIDNMYNIDVLSSEVVGIVGVPVEINTTSKFDKAIITFEYDESRLGNVPEENLCVMWYDEDENWYEILDQSSIVDTKNNTVSVETTHFSTYLVVDREAWYEVWRKDIKYSRNESAYDVALVIDKSGSMSGTNIANVKEATKNFVMKTYENDRVCVVAFNSEGEMINNLQVIEESEDKKNISNTIRYSINTGGGTSTNAGLKMALDELINNKSTRKQSIVLLCDGDVDDPTAMIKIAKEANINVHTINFGSGGETLLKKISDETGGKYCYARTGEEMLEAFYETFTITSGDIETKDSDFDGIYDTYEIVGMRLSNGKIVTSDPFKAHSDKDGYSDFKEMEQVYPGILKYIGNNESGYVTYFSGRSNPRLEDSDGDGIRDNIDKEPLKDNYIENMFTLNEANDESNPIYIEVDKNTVTINARIKFENAEAYHYFKGTNKTYAQMVIDGIKERWETDINGSEFDFCPGLDGKVITNIEYYMPNEEMQLEEGMTCLYIYIYDKAGSSLASFDMDWNMGYVGEIHMYTGYVQYGETKNYSQEEYKGTSAHEFGHTLGLYDAYPKANNWKESNNIKQISDGTYGISGNIMYSSGIVYANDVEMMLQAFVEDTMQYPMDYTKPTGQELKQSIVVRDESEDN